MFALVFKKYWKVTQVVLISSDPITIYITASFAPNASNAGVTQVSSVSETNVPFTAIVCLDILSTGLFPHVNKTYIATSLIPRPVRVIGTFPES